MLSDIALVVGIYCLLNASSPPSLTGGDSGELLAVGCALGTAHPPGYPLYTLMINMWTMIDYFPRIHFQDTPMQPFSFSLNFDSTRAWKVGNLSCILSAFTCLLIKGVAKDLLRSNHVVNDKKLPLVGRESIAPSIVAVLFSLSPIVWEYSNTAEVFALNNFLCAFVLFCTSRVYSLLQRFKSETKQNSSISPPLPPSALYVYLYFGALFSGLCLANQHASFFLVAVLILSILLICVPYRIINLQVMYGLSCMFTLGLSPYLYLVYSAVNVKRGSWGDFSSAQGLLSHVFRSEYGTFQLGVRQGDETSLERLALSFLHASRECFHVLWPLFFIGFVRVFYQALYEKRKDRDNDERTKKSNTRKEKKAFAIRNAIQDESLQESASTVNKSLYFVILSAYIFYQILWHFVLSNLPISVAPMAYAVHARFWMQPLMLVAILSSVGIATIEHAILSIVMSSNSPSIYSKQVYSSVHFLITICLLSFICNQRWHRIDRSSSGWIMHRYGQELLSSLPQNSLLLAHTDLDLNAVRYLRECEGMRSDVSHLSFQMMPYPWFAKVQASLYPNISFVEPFEGISTDRKSQGNAYFVHTFIVKNLEKFNAIYLDMQSINDAELGDKGLWHGLTLIPFGSLYRVVKTPPKSMKHHKDSMEKLQNLSTIFDRFDEKGNIFEVYPPGSWEHAVASVINDAKYQLGVYLLTYAMDAQKSIDVSNILITMDRYHAAASLLFEVVFKSRLPVNLKHENLLVTTYENSFPSMLRNFSRPMKSDTAESTRSAFSGVMKDVDKNCALAWSRYINIVKVARGIADNLRQLLQQENDSSSKKLRNKTKKSLIKKDLLEYILSDVGYDEILKQSIGAIELFVSRYPSDKDVNVFAQELNNLKSALTD